MPRTPDPCWQCGQPFATARESILHTPCPNPQRAASAISRPVHCWACAGEIDLRDGVTCPHCGKDYPVERIGQRA